MKNQLICICGPTASGKTALSVALARQRQTEIISADSMQIYRGMDVGTAKPSYRERAGILHHMMDICEPSESFSVARYVELADRCAQEILAGGHIPIVVGGTGLYMDALIDCNTFSGEDTNPQIREKYQRMAEEKGIEYLHTLLCQCDPESGKRIHPNNVKRVIRALEVFEQTGQTLSSLNEQNRRGESKYDAIKIGLCPSSREVLYERINKRVSEMMQNGLLEEARALLQRTDLSPTAAQAIGYKELAAYFSGAASLEECIELICKRSRNYAKRQLTWLKRDDRIFWIYYNNGEELPLVLQQTTNYLQKHGVQ